MARPKRAITREIRTRRPKRITSEADEQAELGWPEDTVRVSDVMTRPVTTFRTAMTVGAAVKAMRARKIRHAPVLDTRGALVGIVSDRDLRQVTLEPALLEVFEGLGKALNLRTLSQVITWEPLTIKPSAGIREAAQVMHSNKIGALPVVDRGRIVGILTVSDVLKTLIRIIDEGVMFKPGRWGAEA
jgi:acetoin utilization protein AcuB